MWRQRKRRGPKGRIPKPIRLGFHPSTSIFIPQPQTGFPPIIMEHAELEAMRLVDFEGLSQEEAGTRMGVSRGTVWRLLQSARKKAVQALTEGRPLMIRT